ncbi:MAG: Hsp70 family protein, partial [Rhodospirillales bacterium]
AEAHAEEDKKRKAVVEARNKADSLIHSTEKSLGEHGDKILPADKEAIESAIAALKTALEGEDAGEIEAKTQALAEASMKLGEAMYKAAQEAEAGDGAATYGDDAGSDAREDVVDADFEEVDDADKDQKSA